MAPPTVMQNKHPIRYPRRGRAFGDGCGTGISGSAPASEHNRCTGFVPLTRRTFIAAIGAAMLPGRVKAQPTPAPILGVLDSAAANAIKLSTFYNGLKVEGFTRNQNLTVEYHSAGGDYARLAELAADLVNRRVTLITAFGSPAALAAKAATTNVPVVFAIEDNPMEIELVTSISHPGANITGVAGMIVGREQKRLALLHATVPTATVLGFLLNPENANQDTQIEEALAAAQKLGVQLKVVRASTARDFDKVFAELVQSGAGGLVIADDELFLSVSAELGSLTARYRIPSIFQGTAFTAAGGLMSYGTRLTELYHQAGAFSGMVLAGAAPASLPIFQSTAIETIVNLKSAKLLGITLPQPIIDQASSITR